MLKRTFYIVFLFLCSCIRDTPVSEQQVCKTKNVFIVVMDGARFSESWGDPDQQYIPNIKSLARQGVVCTSFWNDGQTATVPGHTSITTGNYEMINNGGMERPAHPSIFQYYRSHFRTPATDAWLITSKDKLEVLSDCTDEDWEGKYRPRTDCGLNGNLTGYREDSVTFAHLIDSISVYHPHLVLVNFKHPDAAGHSNNWLEYIRQISKIDKYIGDLWSFLQSDPAYAGTTTLFVTNDHGRHLNGVYDGFVSHGCSCLGCRRIFMLALGPDFKTDYIEASKYTLVDISATVSRLMGFYVPTGQGKVMTTILK